MNENQSDPEQCKGNNDPPATESCSGQPKCGPAEPEKGCSDEKPNRWQLFCKEWKVISLDRRIELFLASAILVAAIISAGVAWSQWGVMKESNAINRDSFVASSRAWVVPTGAHFDGDPKVGLNQRIKVTYENVGKEAASDVVVWAAWGQPFPVTIDSRQMPYIDIQTAPWPINNTCNFDPSIYINRRAVYPSAKNEFITYGFNGDPYFPKEIIDGLKFFTIYGCIVYRSAVTGHRIHHSPYCLYLQPKRGEPIQNWTFEFCPSGSANAD